MATIFWQNKAKLNMFLFGTRDREIFRVNSRVFRIGDMLSEFLREQRDRVTMAIKFKQK